MTRKKTAGAVRKRLPLFEYPKIDQNVNSSMSWPISEKEPSFRAPENANRGWRNWLPVYGRTIIRLGRTAWRC